MLKYSRNAEMPTKANPLTNHENNCLTVNAQVHAEEEEEEEKEGEIKDRRVG